MALHIHMTWGYTESFFGYIFLGMKELVHIKAVRKMIYRARETVDLRVYFMFLAT